MGEASICFLEPLEQLSLFLSCESRHYFPNSKGKHWVHMSIFPYLHMFILSYIV